MQPQTPSLTDCGLKPPLILVRKNYGSQSRRGLHKVCVVTSGNNVRAHATIQRTPARTGATPHH